MSVSLHDCKHFTVILWESYTHIKHVITCGRSDFEVGCSLQVERIANTEPVSIDVPGVSDISKASANRARQLGVSIERFAITLC